MGANGSFFHKDRHKPTEIKYNENLVILKVLSSNILVVDKSDDQSRLNVPVKSNNPNEVLVFLDKSGSGLYSISVYGNNCEKRLEIHFQDHKGLNPHFHYWKDNKPMYMSKHPLYARKVTKKIKELIKFIEDNL